MTHYTFESWGNSILTNNERTIDITGNMIITAIYREEVNIMGTVTFNGSITAQASVGEQVTITITKPDTSKETIITATKADLTYSIGYTNVAGSYKAKARVEEDALYLAAESAEKTFSIGKEARAITLNVI